MGIKKGIAFLLFIFITLVIIPKTYAEEIDCLLCHGDLKEGRSVHGAAQAGCQSCHANINAQDIPHKLTGPLPKGLGSETPDLCYGCHDKTNFSAATIHAPVGVGMCISCHNPHHSENEKLLVAPKQALCFNCHGREKFTGKKSVHPPAQSGMCLDCHTYHASSNEYLLLNKGNILCRRCHPKTEKAPHAIVGFKAAGHPMRGPQDPQRKGKTFECISCHLPHASDWQKLYRYKAETLYDLCLYCHPSM